MKLRLIFTLPLIGVLFLSNVDAQKYQAANSPATVLSPWLDVHCQVVKRTTDIGHVAFARHFAYTAIAVYEACRYTDASYLSIAPALSELKDMPRYAATDKPHWPAVLTYTYAQMLRHFYAPFERGLKLVDSLENGMLANFRASGITDDVLRNSSIYAKAVAQQVIEWADKDNAFSAKVYTLRQGVDVWRQTPPFFGAPALPYWGEKRSITNGLTALADSLQSPQFSAGSSSAFYKMADEVYQTSKRLTPLQRQTALYWDDSPNGTYVSVFGHWTSILSSVIKGQQPSLAAATAAYAAMSIAMHEASILTWKGKYGYMVLRPVTYIQQYIDSTWLPLIPTPPHPEFPAAHASLSFAAATALTAAFGNECRFTDETYVSIGMPARTYATFNEAATEAGMSRLYGGIHYRHSIDQAFLLGKKAAQHVLNSLHFK